MLLSKPITLRPPAMAGHDGVIIAPQPIEIQELKVAYQINHDDKTVGIILPQIGKYIVIIHPENYDINLVFNKEYLDNTLLQTLGHDPESFLNGLFPKTLEQHPNGAGTVLSNMIKSLGIFITSGCSCKAHAIEMNEKGNDWCDENIDTIVGWLREEASKRKLPFIDAIVKLIVKRAIKKSRKLLANEPIPDNDEELDNI
jgi:hypothetical protein